MLRIRYWTFVDPCLLDSILTFNTHPGEDTLERTVCSFDRCSAVMSTGEEWNNYLALKVISVSLNPFIGLSAMTGDITDAH
jgi:hypothetical protein